jgi:leader peptidase (prepilin peptidase)/N-methyltransferase
MEIFILVVVFIFGAIIGSFLNVVLYRLHTGKSLNGRSHCLSCGKTLQWYELFPIFSYVSQQGKCRGCFSHIPSRYLFVELLTAVSYVTLWHFFAYQYEVLFLYAVLTAVLVVILVYDIRHTIIPDELTLMVGLIALGFLGHGFIDSPSALFLITHIFAGLCSAFFFWGLWYVSKGKWIGLGDAKLALPLGIIVGLGGVFSMVVLSFWIGAVISLGLLGLERLLKRGKMSLHFLGAPLTIKSEVPFAPFLIVGFFLVQLLHADIFEITYALFFPS